MRPIETRDGVVIVQVRVQPKASRNAVCGLVEGRFRIALTAPPIDGAANKALREFVAKVVGIPKSAVVLTAGEKSREKTLALSGTAEAHVRGVLQGAASLAKGQRE